MKITICGSMGTQAGIDLMLSSGKALEGQGHTTFLPSLSELSDYSDIGTDEAATRKHALITEHLRKIEAADAILVTNGEKKGIPGYIGANTLLEMSVAFYLNKPIYLLNPVTPQVNGYDEILGMKPLVLNGNLEAIS